MNKKTLWVTRTALLLAALIVLQWATKSLGQIVTGSCVNCVLAVAALCLGLGSGAVIALVSPVLAYLLGIAPQILTVPAIMLGNLLYVTILALVAKPGGKLRLVLAWLLAAAAKFGLLWLLVSGLLCGVLAPGLLAAGVLKEKMLTMLPAMFSWPQLITALIGGGVAALITPVLRRTLHKEAA